MAADDGTVACDEKGRIVLPKRVREQHGERYFVVDSSDGVWLVPRPEDPVAVLRSLGHALPDVPISELRRAVHEEMAEEAVRRLERLQREARERGRGAR